MSQFNDSLKKLLCFVPDKNEWLRHTFEDPDFEQNLFLGVFDKNQLVGTVLGVARTWKNPHKGFIKFIFAQPSQEESRILTTLLTEIQKRLTAAKISEIHFGSSSPLYLFPGLYPENTTLYNLLLHNNWKNISERINRVIDMKNLRISQSDLADTMNRINCANLAEKKSDIEQNRAYSVSTATGTDREELISFIQNEFSISWAEECRNALLPENYAFCSIIRNNNNIITGFAAVNASNPNWFGPMGVKISLRGNGLGKLLVLYTIIEAEKRFPDTDKLLLPWINDNDKFYCNILGEIEKHSYRKMVFSCNNTN